ncbi:hypothetical protein M9H77_35981 [Catharanthus roseus]|uniref:Uncharacterized protein n=1 Tax=Catharanthus roseus TaxID=4058 RepID=A0ACB9ZT39_CATRO|nr:hypothetical protein M9H77_35981 [Catharanthus roseus]
MQGRNTMEEVLCLSAERGYIVFYRNCEDINVLSDIVITHPTSIVMIRTWPYVLIMDTTYKTSKNIDQNTLAKLTELVKDEEVATRFVNGTRHKLINEIDETEYHRKLELLKTKWQRRRDFLHYLFNTWLNPLAHKFCKVWTSEVLHFSVEITNYAESEHSVLKLWLSTCHGDLDTVFLNVDSVIESQIAEIKSSLDISKLKEKFNAKSNAILKNISSHIIHWALNKIWFEIKRAREIVDDAQNKCGHYLRKSHGLPCACELLGGYEYFLPLQLEDVLVFWRILKSGLRSPSVCSGHGFRDA